MENQWQHDQEFTTLPHYNKNLSKGFGCGNMENSLLCRKLKIHQYLSYKLGYDHFYRTDLIEDLLFWNLENKDYKALIYGSNYILYRHVITID